MKMKILISFLLLSIISTAACGDPNDDPAIPEHPETLEPSDEVSLNMDIVIGDHTITATM